MGNFGAAVTSLLDTYTKCLSLLKSFRSADEETTSETRSTLSSSLRSDRAKIRWAYSSRLSLNGARFEKGDAPARSSLRRIVKRLNAALANVVHALGGHERQPVDFQSLQALSNGSSLDAIRTINKLSSRLGSTASSSSRGSVVSRGRTRTCRHGQHAETGSQGRSEGRSKLNKTRRDKSTRRGTRPVDRRRQRSSGDRHTPEASGGRNRISILTMSSDSTKLGEIRRRRSRQGLGGQSGRTATYPLYSFHAEETQRRKSWWSRFKGL